MQRGGERGFGVRAAWVLAALILFCTLRPAVAFHYAWDQNHDTFLVALLDALTGQNNPNQACGGDPVQLQTGEFVESNTPHDIVIPGFGPELALRFSYRGFDSYSGPFGRGWHTNLTEAGLATTNGVSVSVLCRRGGGQRVQLTRGADGRLSRPPGFFLDAQVGMDGAVTLTDRFGEAKQFAADGRLTSITDRNGNRLTMEYAGGVISRAVAASGRALTFVRGADGRIAQVVDPGGRVWSFAYSDRGELTSVTDPLGNVTRYAYDDAQRMVSITDRRGNVKVRNFFDAQGRVVRQQFADGSFFWFEYRNDGTVRTTNENGDVTTYTVNATGQASATTDPLGRITRQQTNADSQLIGLTDPRGVETRFDYDANGNLTRLIEAFGRAEQRETTFQYDSRFSQLTGTVDPDGNATSITLDSRGNPTQITNALGGVVSLTYDARGLVTATTDERGNRTNYAFNTAGDLVSVTDAEGSRSSFAYDAVGLLTGVTNADGTAEQRTSSLAYDALDRLISVTDAAGATTTMAYDAEGNLVSSSDATGITAAQTYDARNRLTAVDNPASGRTTFAYDRVGNLTQATDALGAATTLAYDRANQLVRMTDALGQRTNFAYDPAGNQTTVTDALSRVTTFTYDALNRRLTRTDPLSQVYTYSYDRRGNVVRIVDAKGQTLDYAYDALSRPTRLTTPDDVLTYTYDAAGNTLAAGNNSSALAFTYDRADRLVGAQTEAGGAQPLVALTQTWDAAGNRRRLEDGLGGATLFDYDAVDQLTRLRIPAGADIAMAYDPAGRLQRIGYPNGVEALASFDAAGRLASLVHRAGFGDVRSFAYGYTTVGNIAQITEGATARTFTYDRTQQLTRDSINGGEVYAYDAVGNRTRSPVSGSYRHDAANRLLEDDTACYAYDANGNRTSKTEKVAGACTGGVTTYDWDAQDQLIRVNLANGGVVSYRYDALGRRIEKDNGGQVVRYVYDGADILLEYDASDALRARYSHGDGVAQPLALERGGSRYFYHADHLGSIRALTDGAGLRAASLDYDAYGQLQGSVAGPDNPYGFTARELDRETSLYYYRARYYDPSMGRFLSEDPFGLAAGDINLYRYVFNNPGNYVDPTGQYLLAGCLIGIATGQAIRSITPNPSGRGPGCFNLASAAWDALQDCAWGAVGGPLGGLLGKALGRVIGPAMSKVGSYLASRAGPAVSQTVGAVGSKAAQIAENRIAGKAGENFLKNTYGGAQQVYKRLADGSKRYIDNLVDGIAQESKVGRMSATKKIIEQVRKDVELLNTPGSGVSKVEWHFFPGKTGVGPTGPLQDLLKNSGIDIIVHP